MPSPAHSPHPYFTTGPFTFSPNSFSIIYSFSFSNSSNTSSSSYPTYKSLKGFNSLFFSILINFFYSSLKFVKSFSTLNVTSSYFPFPLFFFYFSELCSSPFSSFLLFNALEAFFTISSANYYCSSNTFSAFFLNFFLELRKSSSYSYSPSFD